MSGDDHGVLVAAPAGVSAARALAAARTLQCLPDELLRAVAQGLRKHADELAPGALFRGRSAGGCAVGIALRELAPDAFTFGRVEFWVWHRWRRGVERDVAQRFPRLKHLQWHFDESVAELIEAGVDERPALTLGLWLAACAETELSRRGSSRPRLPRTRRPRRVNRRDNQLHREVRS